MRSGIGMGIVAVAVVLVCPAVVLAADEGFNLFKGALDLTIWTIVVFLILFFILQRFAWPQIAAGLDQRERSIARDKEEALKAKHEAEELRKSLAAERARFDDEIRQKIAKAEQDAQQTASEELARGRAELAADKERMLRELRLSTDDALHKLWEQSTQLAALISAKAVRKSLGESEHRALLAEALDEFRAAAESRKENLEAARA